ncbi:hypothetical protein [Mycolicibacterium palauense]|uniref:hypothetical protein n=1 Tax=Mycolicibacterium palauense TaxID=2034511 RepID=UPI001FEB204C|nr:hypothetical protein [Mycolicibacterium palauense]
MGGPADPRQPPGQFLAFSAHYCPLALMLALTPPTVAVNGHPVATNGWGRTLIPVWPGATHVHVHVPYLLPPRIGPADCTVAIAPGQTVALEYRAPLWSFGRGSLGPPPQPYNGARVAVGLLVAALVILAIGLAVVLVSS